MGMLMSIPDNPDARLTRDQTAAALTEAGFPVKAKTLATKASRGGGPKYQLFGSRPLYRWADALSWAQSRLSEATNKALARARSEGLVSVDDGGSEPEQHT
jgi:hypothetical protein